MTFSTASAATPKPPPPRASGPRTPGPGAPWVRAILIACAVLIALVGAAAIVGGVTLSGFIAGAPQIPDQAALWTVRRTAGMTFLDRAGKVIATRGAKYGAPVTLAALPAYVPKAFLAAEDKRFYQHGAVDVYAIVRAAAANMRAHRSVEGGSTLTQQLARTLFLKREQSLKRKVQEAYLAWELEKQLGKDQVLELYMNRSYFGDGAYGLDAASRTYFGKPASQLSLIEAATLAGLPNAPTRLALTNDMQGAVARAHKVLGTMREQGWISEGDLAAALTQTPTLAPAHTGEGDEGYVLDQAAAEATQLAGGAEPDLVVRTTIDTALQTAATGAVREVVLGAGAHRNVSQGALVSLAPDGAILAMVGGVDHDKSPFNRVTQARRQPGSAFKAFVYGAAVEHGDTEQDTREDAPISYAGWNPENYGGGYAGRVTLANALAHSLNTVSVRLTLEVGPATVAEFARRLGLADIPSNPGPSIALGAYEVSPLELAGGYQVFQDGGGRTTPYLVSEVRSTRGDVLYSHNDSAPTPVLDPLYATRMVSMLKGVVAFGTGVGANIGRPQAGKTGTSQDWRDAWFVGFTPDVLTAVWVGNDNGAPMAKVTGGDLPAAIWKRFMLVAEKGLPPRDFPWLVAEPPQAPQTQTETVSDTPSADEPPEMGDAPGRQADMDEPPQPGAANPYGDQAAERADADPGPPPPDPYARPDTRPDTRQDPYDRPAPEARPDTGRGRGAYDVDPGADAAPGPPPQPPRRIPDSSADAQAPYSY